MSLSTQHIVRHLFRVESLEEVSRQQLEELVATHPSFGVGRYLLSQKLQAEGADNFVEETRKTNLYFTNPFWLQWLLQDAKGTAVNGQAHVVTERVVPAEEVFAPVVDPTEETLETEVAHVEEPDEVGAAPAEVVEEVPGEHVQAVEEMKEEPVEVSAPSAADELLKSIAALQDQRRETQQAAHKEEETEEPSQNMGIAGLALEQLEENEAPVVTGHMEEHAVEDIHFVEGTPVEGGIAGELEEAGEDGKQVWETEGNEVAEEMKGEPVKEEDRSEVADGIGGTTNEKRAEEAAVFEPYHTIDYFASQGIRLVLEDNPTDRLGQQMKSFTDWLKIMRRLPQKNREIIPDIAAEHHVQAIAAHSIERKEIITETMAEVLAKQGMREKATEMYRKLSLLEPQKSAYFAEKIEKLKII